MKALTKQIGLVVFTFLTLSFSLIAQQTFLESLWVTKIDYYVNGEKKGHPNNSQIIEYDANGIPVDLKGSFYRFINPKDGNQLIGGFAFLPEGVTFEDQSTDPTKPEFRRLNPKLKFFQNDIRTKNFLEVKDWKSTIPATVNLETVRTILNKRVEK